MMLPLFYACNGAPQVPAGLSMKLQAAHSGESSISFVCLFTHNAQHAKVSCLVLMLEHGVKTSLPLFHYVIKRQPAEFEGPDYFFLAEAGFALPFLFFLSAAACFFLSASFAALYRRHLR